MDKANKLLLKLLKQKEKRDASAPKRINTKQNKKQRKLRVEQFLPKVRPKTKLEEQLEGVRRKRIMDLEYKKKLAELKTQRELQIESIATPSVETLIKQEKRKAGRPKKVATDVAIKAIEANKELYEMNLSELKEEARKEGIKTTQTKTDLIKQITALKERMKSIKTKAPIQEAPAPAPAPIKQEKKLLYKMTKVELQEEATNYGLTKKGNKQDIIDRINKHLTGETIQPPKAEREPTEAERANAEKTARLFNALRYDVNPEIPADGAFPQEEIVKGYQELAQQKATNDAYEAQEIAEEANYVLPLKLEANAKQGEIMDNLRQNDEQAVEKAVNKKAKVRAIKKK
jgi:ribosomal protein L34E